MQRLLTTAALVFALALAACGDDDGDGGSSPAGNESAPAGGYGGKAQPDASGDAPEERKEQAKPGTEITVSSSQFGDIVFDGRKQAIYLFDAETTSKPECYGECAAAWPPVLTEGEPVASGAAKQSLLGTTKRDDGTTQVTYAGQPLYYYAHEGPGEVLCHNVSEFGGLWLVLDASGDALS